MPEMGVQAIVTDTALATARIELEPIVRQRMTDALLNAGCAEPSITIHKERAIHGPHHLTIDTDDEDIECAYLTFQRENPGSDWREYPECGNDEHWSKGWTGWEFNGYGHTYEH